MNDHYILGGFVIAVVTVASAATLPRRYAIVAALAGAVAVILAKEQLYPHGLFDDAFITFRYSRNLSEGRGPVWNPGQHVEGYTGFSWMAILAGLHRIGFDLPRAAWLLSYASLIAAIALAWRIWELWAEDLGGAVARPMVLAASLLCIGLSDPITTWGTSGLETPLAAALLTGTVYLYLRESRRVGVPWSAVAAAAAAMTRPELLFIGAVTGMFTVVPALLLRDPRRMRSALLWVVLFTAMYGAYFVWRYSYYGYVFPNTYYAKVGTNSDFYHRGFEYVRTSVWSAWLAPFLAGTAFMLLAPARVRRDAQYIVAVALIWLLAIVVEGGDAYPHGRFLAPLVPALAVGGFVGYGVLLERVLRKPATLAVGAAAILIGVALTTSSSDAYLAEELRLTSDVRALGHWLRQSTPPDFALATVSAGAIPYDSELRSLDLLGLSDETIAHTKVKNFGKGIPAHEKYNTDYVLSLRPELIIIGPYPSVLPRQVLQAAPSLAVAMNSLLADPRTFDQYEAVAHYGSGTWFNLLQRKDTIGRIDVEWTESGGYRDGFGPVGPTP